MQLISPTQSLRIRSDPKGDGHFGALRGNRTHQGIDLLVVPKQEIVSPADCQFIRLSNPYKDDNRWNGLLLTTEDYEIFIWYIFPYWFRKGEQIATGEQIGVAQNITFKYGAPMLPHIHLGIKWKDGVWINPYPLLEQKGDR